MTEVYVFHRGPELFSEDCAALLPLWRQQRLEKLRYPPARQESLGAGLLYAFALRKLGLSIHEPVTILSAGKPVLTQREDIWFSLSHSGDWAACAVSDVPVGVDVQLVRPVKLSIARRLHPGEREWLSQQSREEQTMEFFRLWTRKEAWVKAQSRDRMVSLSQVDVIHRLAEWRFRDYILAPDVLAALCTGGTDVLPEPCMVEREELFSALS
jgi:4'-phosphopantetheinyl transferase